MVWSDFIQGILSLSLIGPGIGGNVLMFVGHVYMFVRGPEKRNIDLILMHLAFTNAMSLCAKGVSDVISAFHLSNFLSNVGCKAVIYLERVARGLSICTTCLLSVVQATTISSKATTWTKFKPQTARQLLHCLLCFWVFNILIGSNLLYYITSVNSMNRSAVTYYVKYCYMQPAEPIVRWLFLTLMAVRDLMFQGLMGWNSGCMASHLYVHHKCVLYLRSSRFTKKKTTSPEIRATQSILLLMACFLFFYWADFIFSFYIGSFLTNELTIFNIKIFLTLGYASLSPFMLIGRNVHLVHCW
ncbi:LOW QUALITY PROTEIN: putative vomeronasal receptor-like protein 4 [Echinops telfairi]|uniref:Vomeronasal type-1 receptor n=1 Tax=Echinops telfairi TaxID=9371 RepID=A0ABM1VLJ3_ECHTE|nr:LOW QUALITY PROTEIN: putative vomeronasal receptor-like protein 4 [Echinops telfairi]